MTLRRGSTGEAVGRVQARLRELGFYLGPIDEKFGGGTESAVKSYQKAAGLGLDGQVGPTTWARLFPSAPPPENPMLGKPVNYRCLALTGTFETSAPPPECFCGLTGDFDGQGISFGVLQWNFGQGSLQPMLKQMIQRHRGVAENVFHDNLPVLEAALAAPKSEQMAFARSIQDGRHRIIEPWRGLFRTLARTPEYQNIQVEQAAATYNRALDMARTYGLTSQRGVALMFDIVTQNGSISDLVKAQILRDFALVPDDGNREVARMRIIAQRRAAAARPEFMADVLKRKMTIADGTGEVHGRHYDLEEQFGLTLSAVPETGAAVAG